MNPLANPKHAAAPVCPRSGRLMVAESRCAKAHAEVHARVGNPRPPARTVDVWRCAACNIDRPHF